MALGLAALWVVGLFVILPALVSAAYAGDSGISLLNRIINGQSQHPVEYYQSLARRAALLASAGGLLVLAALAAAWYWRQRIATNVNGLLRSGKTVGSAELILVGAWSGWISGLLEAIAVYIRFGSDPVEAPPAHILWTGPVSAACLGALVAALLALVMRARRGVSLAVPIALFTAAAVYAIATSLRLGLHHVAVVLLSLGVAIQFGRVARRRTRSLARSARGALPWMAGVSAGIALVIAGASAVQERADGRLRGTAPAGAPNVLLLILDTVRAQDLGLYGYARQTSPEIERLASSGVTFDRALATAPWTLTSHASMFTGAVPDSLSTDFHAPLDETHPTIAEVLRTHGYATGGFVANLLYTSRSSGLDRGFTTYRDYPVTLGLVLAGSFWSKKAATAIRPLLGVHGGLVHKTAADVNREFLAWMPDDGRPFFAFLNYFDAHLPYRLERPFDEKFHQPAPRYWRFKPWDRFENDADIQEFRDSYNSAIAYIDAQVGELLRELQRRGTLDNTLVILAADHGEHFGEHGGIMSHGNSLYLPLLHVPLVMSYPSRIPTATRVRSAVSLRDLPVTILDVLGLSDESPMPGRSLARYWSSAVAEPSGAEVVFSSLSANDFAHRMDPVHKGPMQSLVLGNLHYIRNGDQKEELYDFLADNAELTNLAQGTDSARLLEPFRQWWLQRADQARLTSR